MFVVCLLIVGISAVCGKLLTTSLIKRDKFFLEMLNFCEYIKTNITFSHTKVSNLFDGYIETYNSEFKEIFENFKNFDDNKNEDNLNKIFFLKKEEKSQIVNFVKQLGNSNVDMQISHIENFKNFIQNKSTLASDKRKQNAPLCYKVCISVGMIVSILIM